MHAADRELDSLLERAGVEGRLRSQLARYGAFVLDANRRFNLTGAKSPEELAVHLLDSLTVAPYLREPYVDVGSGAGFPAIPAALAAGIAVTMVEATTKRARFLESACARLGLASEVVAQRAEIAARSLELRERFASGTARALAAGPTVAEFVLPFIALGGVAILQRGRADSTERQALEDASLMLGGSVDREIKLDPGRRIVLLRKTAPTPPRFPRRPGIPEKRPLCL
jgi:16S rRNA (guanine527-N7)-methyltransferase